MICDAELCGGHAGPSRFVVVLHGCHRIDEIGLDCASSKAGQTIRDSPASLVRVDAGPVNIKFRCLVQDGHEEAATLGVMRQPRACSAQCSSSAHPPEATCLAPPCDEAPGQQHRHSPGVRMILTPRPMPCVAVLELIFKLLTSISQRPERALVTWNHGQTRRLTSATSL